MIGKPFKSLSLYHHNIPETNKLSKPSSASSMLISQFLLNPNNTETTTNGNIITIGQSGRSVAGSQFRSVKRENVSQCHNCDDLNIKLRKCKEIIRSLKLQIVRYEDRLAGHITNNQSLSDQQLDGYSMKSIVSPKSAEIEKSIESSKLVYDLQLKNDELELLVSKLKKQLAMDASGKSETNSRYEVAVNKINELTAQLANHTYVSDRKINMLQSQVDSLSAENESLLNKYCDSEVNIKDAISSITKLQSDLSIKSAQASECKDQLATYMNKHNCYEDKLVTVERRLAECELSLSQQMQLNKQLKFDYENSLNETNTWKDRCDELTKQIQSNQLSCVNHESTINQLANDLSKANQQLTFQSNEIKFLTNELTTASNKLTSQLSTNQKSIELAIAGSVRLCVVAPTVNAHINNNSGKSLQIQSDLPTSQLESFLRSEVLDRYTKVFRQQGDDLAPDGITPLSTWIESMLNEMQRSIESHVNAAMAKAN